MAQIGLILGHLHASILSKIKKKKLKDHTNIFAQSEKIHATSNIVPMEPFQHQINHHQFVSKVDSSFEVSLSLAFSSLIMARYAPKTY